MFKLPSLHLNTEYSLLSSTIKISELIDFAIKNGLTSLVITDRNNLFGASEFIFLCKKNNIKPIIGLDLEIENQRIIMLAKNNKGYQFLVKISSLYLTNKLVTLNNLVSKDLFYFSLDNNKFQKTKIPFKLEEVEVQETKILHSQDENDILKVLYQIDKNEKKNFNFKPYQIYYSNLNNKKIIDQCNLEISKLKHKLPIFDKSISSQKILKEKIRESLISLEQNKNFPIYLDRVKYEIDIINKLNFIDYFLIISDLCQFARENKILIGPGRGSVSSSLVAYLLKITEVDPIKFNLLFERFLNPFRTSLPDIDLDIQDNRRIEIINYLIDKYGKNKVALITTFQKLQARSSIKDAARYLNYLPSQADEISKSIPISMSLNEAYKKVIKFKAIINQSSQNQELFKIATKIENLPRQIGTHAAGVIITDEPITNSVPILLNGFIQIQFSSDYLENWGITKIDLLGLKNLTIIQEIQNLIYLDYEKTIDLKNIPLTNFKTNQLLSNGYTNGIFQLESKGMKKILKQIKVQGVDDIINVISLYRPGPKDNINLYLKNKKNNITTFLHPTIDSILAKTYGIILFQEQIIEISKVFANFNAIEADLFRYSISKKDKKQFELAKANFFEKAQSMGHSKELIQKTFNYIEHFANYGFNKAHATAYAILSYRLAYLKAHFSTQFYIAIIKNALQSNDTLVKYINEAKTQNIKIIAPNIYYSKNIIYHKDKVIYLSYNIIKSIGSTISNKLSEIKFEKNNNIYDVFILLKKNNISDKIIETLVMGNVFSSLNNMTTILLNLPSLIRYAKLVVTSNFNQEIIQTKPTIEQLEPNYEKEQEYEFKTLGSNFNCFLTKKYEKEIKLANLKENFDNDLIVYVEKIVFLNNREMVVLNISDSSMMLEIFAFDNILEKIKKIKVGLAKIVIFKKNNKFILKDINEFKK